MRKSIAGTSNNCIESVDVKVASYRNGLTGLAGDHHFYLHAGCLKER
jgi:hypothetical protein